MKKFTIWQNIDIDENDWREDYQECHELSDEEMAEVADSVIYEWAYYCNNDYLDDERDNLNVNVGDAIIVIANLGLWDGTHTGYKIIPTGNISECLYDGDCAYGEWYCDRYDMRFTGQHHDGTNRYLYRTWAKNLSENQKENFLEKLYYGKATRKDIKRYTRSIRPWVSAVYGWGGRVAEIDGVDA